MSTQSKQQQEISPVDQRILDLTTKARALGKSGPSAREVVLDAQNTDSPLHGEFNWDIKQAAWSAWEDRARELIRHVHVTITKMPVKRSTVNVTVVKNEGYRVPAYVRDPMRPSNEQGYVHIDDIRDNRILSAEIVRREFQTARAYLIRARNIAIGLDMAGDIDDLLHTLNTLTERLMES